MTLSLPPFNPDCLPPATTRGHAASDFACLHPPPQYEDELADASSPGHPR
jgi:hypothetical protein